MTLFILFCAVGLAACFVVGARRIYRPRPLRPSPEPISGADVIAALRVRQGRTAAGRLYRPAITNRSAHR